MSLIAVLDESFKVIDVNEDFSKYLFPRKTIIGLYFYEIFQVNDQKGIDKICRTFSKMTSFSRKSMRFNCGTNELPYLFLFNWTLVEHVKGFTAVTYDNKTKTINSEAEELRDYFDKAPIALHWLSSNGRVLWANQRELDVLGYSKEEYIGQEIMKFCPDSEKEILQIFKELGSGNTIRDVPVRFRKKNGDIQDLLIDSNVNYTENGDFNHTRCFIRDDTGRMIREAKSKIQIKSQLAITKEKTKFLSMMIHTLRTPVHVLTMLNSDNVKNETELTHQTNILSGIISSISKAIKFDDGYTIKNCPVSSNLSNFISKLVAHKSKMLRNHVDIYSDFTGVTLLIDENILNTILTELLVYADNRTTYGGIVKLFVTLKNDELKFIVEDCGARLDEYMVEKVFHNYWLNCIENSDVQSFDVSLNVAFNCVESMDSKLSVISDDERTQFIFKVNPTILEKIRRSDSFATDTLSDLSSVKGPSWTDIDTIDSLPNYISKGNVEISKVERGISLNDVSKHILIVEDNSICQRICKRFVEKLGHTCATADNGLIAVKVVDECGVNIYDLVFMDIRMPIMDGLEASKRIKKIYPDIPIVAFTAEEFFLDEMKESGMISHMSKPATISDIEYHINEYSL